MAAGHKVQSDAADDSTADNLLIKQVLDGDDGAFAALVSRYEKQLYHFLVRFVGSRSIAEDVFQESFLQVYQSLERFDQKKTFKPWLFTIAANKARDQLRKSKRQRTFSLSAPAFAGSGSGNANTDGPGVIDLLEASLPAPDADLQQAEFKQQVRAVIDAMPDHLREVLLLAYFNQFAYAEIADMLSVPLGTVKSRLHSAVATFGRMWKQATEASTDG